jgi:threonine synthase
MDISKASNFERFVFDLSVATQQKRGLFEDALGREGRFDLSRTRSSHRPRRASASRAAAACMQTDSPPSAIPTKRFATLIDTHTADGLKAAREHLCRRAHDRSGDRAAHQVRRNDR